MNIHTSSVYSMDVLLFQHSSTKYKCGQMLRVVPHPQAARINLCFITNPLCTLDVTYTPLAPGFPSRK